MRVVDTLEPGQVDPMAELGNERMAATLLRQAMSLDHVVTFDYDGKPRTVEVHAIGLSTKDNSVVMRGFMDGDAWPWRLFTVSKIEGLAIAAKPSAAPREGYAQGDKQMRVVLSEIKL